MPKKPKTPEPSAQKIRELAVKAQVDPRTILKVLHGEEPKSMSAQRAYDALLAEGLVG